MSPVSLHGQVCMCAIPQYVNIRIYRYTSYYTRLYKHAYTHTCTVSILFVTRLLHCAQLALIVHILHIAMHEYKRLLIRQLLWREFFYLCAHTVPNFGQMEGNALCKQIPWDNNPEYLAGEQRLLSYNYAIHI
jgi:hypothetical protein